MPYFEVAGTSAKTGKPLKTKTFQAFTEVKARTMAQESGMVVSSAIQLPEQEPTEKQIEYARDLGISIPSGTNRREVSDLISCEVEFDEPADSELRALADTFEIDYTKFVGRGKLCGYIWNSPAIQGDNITAAWFTYCVYRDLLPKRVKPVATTPDHPALQEIANKVAQDASLMESIYRYRGSNLSFFGQKTTKKGDLVEGGSNRTKAYKEISAYLRQDATLGLPSGTERKPASGSKAKAVTSTKSGCAIMLLASCLVCMLVICAIAAALR